MDATTAPANLDTLRTRYARLAALANTTPKGSAAARVFHADAWDVARMIRDRVPTEERAAWESTCNEHLLLAGRRS